MLLQKETSHPNIPQYYFASPDGEEFQFQSILEWIVLQNIIDLTINNELIKDVVN